MSTQIVQVNVSQTLAPAPILLQQTGAFVSQGATTTAPGTLTLLSSLADLAPILAGAETISTITWATGVATVTVPAGHGIPVGDTLSVVISGCTPTGYNGTFQATATSSTVFTYPLTSSPGLLVTPGVATLGDVAELNAMATTFFAQGTANAIYVLELGIGTGAEGITALNTYIQNNLLTIYAYMLPTAMSSDATFLTFAKNYNATTAQVYFWIKASLTNYSTFTGNKSIVALCQDVTAPSTEWSPASMLWVALNYNPSNTNKVTPMAFAFVVGVTAFTGTQTQAQALRTAGCNYIGTGAEGGISNTLILWGTTADKNDYTYWYSVDWVQENINLSISNAIINGSNNPINPLYYNQAGINTLQKVAQGTMNSGIAFGLVLGPVTVLAVPFALYVQDNPSDYAIGKYSGLSVSYTPARGFTQIIFNVNVSSFALV
jgi:hypothetical protein